MSAEIIHWQPELFDDPATVSMRLKIAQIASEVSKAKNTLDKVRKAHWGSCNEQDARLATLEERLDRLERFICRGK